MAIARVVTAHAATGAGDPVAIRGKANFTIRGTFVGTVKLERSFDGGTTWDVVSRDSAGNEAAYTGRCSIVFEEPQAGVLYRSECTAFVSGPAEAEISQ